MNFIKTKGEKLFLLFGFILILVAGFFSGYSYSQEQIEKQSIIIEDPDESCVDLFFNRSEINLNSQLKDDNASSKEISTPKQNLELFVASKNSKLYHKADCVYVNRIKEENKIFFNSAQEAEDMGLKFHCAE
ncbi:hypothetical protein KAK05_01365 [Candidatus Parcubacteria bacterium]|nr:hypothetical protein [Candidatus Parcubacteria bacterium]